MSLTSAAASVFAQQRRNPGLAAVVAAGASGHRRGAGGALVVLQRAGHAGRRRGLAEPVLERCQGRSRDYSTIVGEGLDRFHHGAGPKPARADRRAGAGAQASDRELPATGATYRAAAGVMRGQAKRVERRHRETWQVLRSAAAKFPNVRLIDPVEVFCDRDTCWPFGPKGLLLRRQGPSQHARHRDAVPALRARFPMGVWRRPGEVTKAAARLTSP